MAIAYQNSVSGVINTNNYSFNVGSGSNRYLLVGALKQSSQTITGITYGGVAMTKLASLNNGDVSLGEETSLWGLANPPAGANTLTMSFSGSGTFAFAAVCYNGVDSSSGSNLNTLSSATSQAETISLTTLHDNSWLAAFFRTSGSLSSPNTGTTLRNGGTATNISMADSNAAKSPAGSYSLGYSDSDGGCNLFIVELIPPTTASTNHLLGLLGVGN